MTMHDYTTISTTTATTTTLLYTSFFFISAGGLSFESKWQQVSSGLQNIFVYSSRSQQFCSLGGLDCSADF